MSSLMAHETLHKSTTAIRSELYLQKHMANNPTSVIFSLSLCRPSRLSNGTY